MWIVYALLSALFAGITSVLVKCGIKQTDSSVVTALRTGVVLVMSFITVAVTGSMHCFNEINGRSVLFLVLSGIATGASWLCYFKALSVGEVSAVAPIDKMSAVLTAVICFLFFGEDPSPLKWISLGVITAGTLMMSVKKRAKAKKYTYIPYAVASAVFASLNTVLAKIGVDGVQSDTATFLRTAMVLVMAWTVVFVKGKQNEVKKINKKDIFFICLSGIATGASWLLYYRALKEGQASAVVSIDKSSMVFTVAFSLAVLKEKIGLKEISGLLLTVLGTLGMTFL